MYSGIWFDEVHTCKDWGLKLISMAIPMPETKTNYLEIPGANGAVDLTEVLTGDASYNNREGIEFVFESVGDYVDWHSLTSKIANYLHGRKRKIIIDSDPNYYYVGRMVLDSQKTDEVMNHIVITGTTNPFKYEKTSSTEPWFWDSFSFIDGIIRNYGNLQVNGNLSLKIYGRRMRIVPDITVSAAMDVTYLGKTYHLSKGKNKIYDIHLSEGENILKFTGNGTISIDYRGGSL